MNNQEDNEELQKEIVDNLDSLADLLNSLGHKKRIIILTHLLDGQKKFSFLEEKTALKKTALAHHLNVLLNNGLINKIDRGEYEITQDARDILKSIMKTYSSSSIRTIEIAKSLQKRFFLDYGLEENITSKVTLVSSDPEFIPHNLTLLGAISGIMKALGSKITIDELAGLTGLCFLTIIDQNRLWVTAPSGHTLTKSILEIISNSGWVFQRYTDIGTFPSDPTKPLSAKDEERAQKLLKLTKREIDKDRPVVLWGIPVPEWGIVKGYKDENYIVSTFRRIEDRFENQIPYNKINADGALGALFLIDVSKEKINDVDYKESIRRAVSISKVNRYGREGHITGLRAFDKWIYLLENEIDQGTKYFGNAYLIQTFLASKKSVVIYLKKLSNTYRNQSQQAALDKAVKEYLEVVEIYEKLQELFPLIYGGVFTKESVSKGVNLIKSLKNHEEEGVKYLEQSLDEWK